MPDNPPPLRIGVIGYGYWGPNLARNAAQLAVTELAAIADTDARRLAIARTAYPVAGLHSDARAILADPSIDAVLIATPPETHCALVVEALERGKHVLVEKPLATSKPDAERMVAAARASGRVLAVDHTFLFTGAVRRMKEYCASGQMGEVYYYDSTRINLGIFRSRTNVIWDLAPHDLAIMLHLLGARVTSVAAVGARHVDQLNENIAYITLQFADSLLAHFHVNWLAPTKVRRTIIGASARMLVYDDMEPDEKLKVYDSGVELVDDPEEIYGRLVEYRTGDIVVPKLDKTEALAYELGHFVNVVRGREAPISDGAFGAEVVAIIEAAQRSLRRNGIPELVER